MGVRLSDGQVEAFLRYIHLLLKWNRRINLIGTDDPSEIIVRHLVDSLLFLEVFPSGAPLRVIDLGSGAGLPGIPVKIARPDDTVVLVESRAKKASFLREAVRVIRLPGVAVYEGRIEEIAGDQEHGGRYDVVVMRAVSPEDWLRTALSCVRIGGRVILSRGKGAAALEAWLRDKAGGMGGRLAEVVVRTLPVAREDRTLFAVEREAT
ncbi:MAG: 16S rRNA (guanine(527)-N(7))-methyltransferase RsmG [Nitrospirae bacterium RBG_16_64_22]|nr:MAG: 16S rRNA (guanine(527)-N(7))-methyltransferase RsmG [Nitrospirae bacterium RBG_16_64_22]